MLPDKQGDYHPNITLKRLEFQQTEMSARLFWTDNDSTIDYCTEFDGVIFKTTNPPHQQIFPFSPKHLEITEISAQEVYSQLGNMAGMPAQKASGNVKRVLFEGTKTLLVMCFRFTSSRVAADE